MFDVPVFDIYAVAFTAIGVVFLWARLGQEKIRAFALSRLIEGLGISGNTKMFAEFVVFVVLGAVVGVAVVQPNNAPQAIAAGMGWTGLLAQPLQDNNDNG